MSIQISVIEASIPKELQGEKMYTVQEAFANLRKKVKEHYLNADETQKTQR